MTIYDGSRGRAPTPQPSRGSARRSVADAITVELCNYRADGSPFTNRVSLVLVPDANGTVEHWFGLRAAVNDDRRSTSGSVEFAR